MQCCNCFCLCLLFVIFRASEGSGSREQRFLGLGCRGLVKLWVQVHVGFRVEGFRGCLVVGACFCGIRLRAVFLGCGLKGLATYSMCLVQTPSTLLYNPHTENTLDY